MKYKYRFVLFGLKRNLIKHRSQKKEKRNFFFRINNEYINIHHQDTCYYINEQIYLTILSTQFLLRLFFYFPKFKAIIKYSQCINNKYISVKICLDNLQLLQNKCVIIFIFLFETKNSL